MKPGTMLNRLMIVMLVCTAIFDAIVYFIFPALQFWGFVVSGPVITVSLTYIGVRVAQEMKAKFLSPRKC